MTVIDLTREQTNPPAVKRKHLLGPSGKVLARDPSAITGIVVHQTACFFGVSPAQLRASGGDRALALHRRGLRVACHVIAFADGVACHVNPFEWHVHHGNGFNATTLGLEIEGVYQGALSMRRKPGEVPLGWKTIRAAKESIDYMIAEGKKRGTAITDIYAHRQSSADRRADPGEEIWKKVVLGHAVGVHGLRTHVELALPASNRRNGPGRPIPRGVGPARGRRVLTRAVAGGVAFRVGSRHRFGAALRREHPAQPARGPLTPGHARLPRGDSGGVPNRHGL